MRTLQNVSLPNKAVDDTDKKATEPFDEVMDRNLKGLRAERLSAEAQVVEARRNLPGNINRASNYLEKLRTAGEWLPADEIPEDGMSTIDCEIDD